MKLKATALCAAIAFFGGCIVETAHHPHERVVIEAGHVHSETCGHYYAGGQWYWAQSHHHGPGCGHVFRGGVWVID